MTKPVNLDEMVLRVRALLRRSHIASNKRLTLPHTILDYDALTVTWGDDPQMLPQKEFFLLFKLISYPNKIFTRMQLMDKIWGATVSQTYRPLMYISTGCADVLRIIRILRS